MAFIAEGGLVAGAVALAAVAVLAAAPASAEPSSVGIPGASDIPGEIPIPGGFRGFSGILRFTPPQPRPPEPQMPLGRRLAGAARTGPDAAYSGGAAGSELLTRDALRTDTVR
ncbi:hypothetical protein OHA40_00960 [Nocardia sp. NBC_00508]|uniref:hypothetical protein n=1 Tax=Nocardia sp. NBC_00508 TaxID=2975992 RepID=UPI002E80507F|nr:hypothetical protein [Nocardia sp. NBC_00508]WUD66775.1 hypothetical protein OHA40_00960 [Nocardia sp. NBC_00508]